MPHHRGYRAKTRHMFSRGFRQKGNIGLSTYLTTYKVGQMVDIKVNAAVHKGMPHKTYHGRTGVIYNVTPRAVGVVVNKLVRNKVLKKRINVRIEHVKPSRCREDFLERVKVNDVLKHEAALEGKTISTKRKPILPKDGYTCKTKNQEIVTVTPVPHVDLF